MLELNLVGGPLVKHPLYGFEPVRIGVPCFIILNIFEVVQDNDLLALVIVDVDWLNVVFDFDEFFIDLVESNLRVNFVPIQVEDLHDITDEHLLAPHGGVER